MNTHTETQHTPGPWKIEETNLCSSTFVDVVSEDGWLVAEIESNNPKAESNALLIAAAPDLLRDLQAVLQRFDAELGILTDGRYSIKDFPECVEALKTIAKTTEGAQ